jgi:GT2 family glycosyltransferase
MITVCIPTLNRYDLLKKLIVSAESGIVKPDNYIIIDNGNKLDKKDLEPFLDKIIINSYGYNIGVATSWNKFIIETDDIRLICNDDLEFDKNSIKSIVDQFDERFLMSPDSIRDANMFSCFCVSNYIVSKVGLFDEKISPNYAYFEDNDYFYRLGLAGIGTKSFENCIINHNVSSTLKRFSPIELQDHHSRFNKAGRNYIKKWGGLPTEEKFTTPYGT